MHNIERGADLQNSQLYKTWLNNLYGAREENSAHFWGANPDKLITKSHIVPDSFTVGNGADVYSSTVVPAVQSAKREILFVTCFWAQSPCLDQLGKTLIELSERAKSKSYGFNKLRVRLCFSSRSVTQKLFHTSSPNGYTYKPTEWSSRLGLPAPESLTGLDFQVKSLFFLPFSVMHPKFVIIDRKYALLPSCNLSYESWFEGCLRLKGAVVDQLVLFWKETWGPDDLPSLLPNVSRGEETTSVSTSSHTVMLLPSPHHRSPRFRPFLSVPKPPQTPLNTFLGYQIKKAKSSVKIITPNLTCQQVISSLLAALARGVDVLIITNRRMMVLEQLLTAGTLTEICMWRLNRRYEKLVAARKNSKTADSGMEAGHSRVTGTLILGYFRPNSKYAQSHFKCTVVDLETVILGSGNMDRASWYTSQELGVAVEGAEFVGEVLGKVCQELNNGRGVGGAEANWIEWVRTTRGIPGNELW